MHSAKKPLVLGLVLVAVVALASACAAPDPPKKERRSSTTSALGKPKPTLKAAASKETTAQYGIKEWRMFRGKEDLYMTGYDADGKAVKGMSVAFGDSKLVTHVNDGSKAVASRNLETEALESDALPEDSVAFLQQMSGDLDGISDLIGGAGLPDSAIECGADLAAVCKLALQCCAGLYWGGNGSVDSCWAAAKAAVKTGAACASAAKEIDLSKYGAPSGGGLDVGSLLGGYGTGAVDLGGLGNVFGGGDALACDPETGDVDFAEDPE